MTDFATPRAATKRQLPRSLGAVVFALDIVGVWLAFQATKFLSGAMVYLSNVLNWDVDFHHFDTRRYYYIFLCFFILLRFVIKGHYSRRPPWLAQIETIIKTIAIAAIFDSFNHYVMGNQGLPLLILLNWFLCILFIIAARLISLAIISRSDAWKLPIALVGNTRMVMDSFYAFTNDESAGYDIKIILLTNDDPAFDLSFLPAGHPPVEILRDAEFFPAFIQSNKDYYYIFGMEELRGARGEALTDAIEQAQVEYGVIPHTKTLDVYGMEPHYFFGNDIMILHRRDSIRSPSGRILKRLLDIGATALALPILGILTVIVYVMKKMEGSDTPVFYDGERIGRNGRKFRCWKFCTMKKDADSILQDLLDKDPAAREEWDKYQKLKNDPRVDSKISAFLRKTSLDEIPQLWSVFVGDMSLVGPRPILENQIADYGDMYRQYCAVRPGLTGLWQVSGRNETSFQQRVYWDSWYIRNWSLWYDIVIIFKTVKVLFTRRGAY